MRGHYSLHIPGLSACPANCCTLAPLRLGRVSHPACSAHGAGPAISAPWIHLLQQKLIGAGMERAQEAAAPQATCISMPLSTGGPAASALSLAPGLAGSPAHSKRSTRQGNEVLSYSSRLQLREGVWGRGREELERMFLGREGHHLDDEIISASHLA